MPKNAKKNHGLLYETLGLKDNNVTFEEVKSAFVRLSFACHPDRNLADPTRNDKQKAVVIARKILSNRAQKAKYDKNPAFWDKKIFGTTHDGIPNLPSEIDTLPLKLVPNVRGAAHSPIFDFGHYNDFIKNLTSYTFDELFEQLLADYRENVKGQFVFSRKYRSYVNNFNSNLIFLTDILKKSLNDDLLAVMYASLWLLTIMEKGNPSFIAELNIDNSQKELLKSIFTMKEVKSTLADTGKLIKQNEFLSRILLMQYISKVVKDKNQPETEDALKFGLWQLRYRVATIREVTSGYDNTTSNAHTKSSALLRGSLYTTSVTTAAIIIATPILYLVGTPLVPMTVLGALTTSLIASTLFLGIVPVLALVGLTIAAAVYAKKFGNAIEQEKQYIHAQVKQVTTEELEKNKNRYNFFQKKVCAIATKLELIEASNNEVSTSQRPMLAI